MKQRKLNRLAIVCLLIPWASLVSPAQEQQQGKPAHLGYKLIDLGTFGGPNSSETVEFPYINNRGMVVGFADTSIPDPSNPEGFFIHAFRWQHDILTDLGTLPAGLSSFAIWSNNRGEVVGLSGNGLIDPALGTPEGRAVLWDRAGNIADLGTLGGDESLAGAINNRGQIIGVASNDVPDRYSIFGWATQTRAFVWKTGSMQDLGTLGGTDASPSFINQSGQIAGVSYVNSNPSVNCDLPLTTHPFLWQDGKMIDLGTLGGTCSGVASINDGGEVAGTSNLKGDETAHPFLWHNGKLNDLGTIGGTFGLATWLNDAGDVAGAATTADDQEFHAFFWRNGVTIDIGTVAGDTCSVAHFMNLRGEVSGTSGDCAGEFERHGFVWRPGGPIIDLNDFVPPGSDLTITDGETINDRGEIAGSGKLPNGDFHAVVLMPCDAEHGHDGGCQESGQKPHAARQLRPARDLAAASKGGRKLSPRELVERFLSGRHISGLGSPKNR